MYYINLLKAKLLRLRNILLENKYISKITDNNNKIEVYKFNNQLLINGITSIYFKDLLNRLKTGYISQYEEEVSKQKYLSEFSDNKHNNMHRQVLKNIEILLSNIATLETRRSLTEDVEEECIAHIKKILGIEEIINVKLPTNKK